MDQVLDGLAMGMLALVNVGLFTLRVALTARGRRLLAAVVAGMDAVMFAVAIGSLLTDLGSPGRLVGYALGVGLGTMLGIVTDERMAAESSELRIVVDGDHGPLLRELRDRGWPVTAVPGAGLHGPVTVLFVVVDDTRLRAVQRDLRQALADLGAQAFWTVERLRVAHPIPLPAGFRQVRQPHEYRIVHHGRTGAMAPGGGPDHAASGSATGG